MTITHEYYAQLFLFLLLPSIHGHMVMNNPPPFKNGPLGRLLQVDPLDITATGTFQFPCQAGPSGIYGDQPLVVAPRDSIQLKFTGQAVHWGGSCQVALSKTPSDQPKDWKVIHSMIGGCPATYNEPQATGLPLSNSKPTDTDGRLNGDDCTHNCQTGCKKIYGITIDERLPNGKYFFSWTWFNKAGGRRELYQNCAPIEIRDSSGTDDYFNSLPTMFVSDVAGQCNRTDGTIVIDIPNPGNVTIRSSHGWDQPPANDPTGGLGSECAARYSYSRINEAVMKLQMDECAGKWVAFPQIPLGVQAYASGVMLSPASGYSGSGGHQSSANTTSRTPANQYYPVLSATLPLPVTSPSVTVSSYSISQSSPPEDTGEECSQPTQAQSSTGQKKCGMSCVDGAVWCFDDGSWGVCDKGGVVHEAVLQPGTECLSSSFKRKKDPVPTQQVVQDCGTQCIPGSIWCFSSSEWGLCKDDHCVVRQRVAPGTHCMDGQIMASSLGTATYLAARSMTTDVVPMRSPATIPAL